MITTKARSKSDQVFDALLATIESGACGIGSRIPSENELGARFGVNRATAREAITSLVQRGLVHRIQGKGTFVVEPPKKASSNTYAIFTYAHEHMYEAETRALVKAFQRYQSLSVVIDVEELQDGKQTDDILVRLLDQGVAGVVVADGIGKRLQEVCARTGRPMPPLAIMNHAGDPALPALSVITDELLGSRIATRHLIGLGRRRILFIIHRYLFGHPDTPPDAVKGMYGDMVRGYTSTMAEAGFPTRLLLIDHEFAPGSEDRERLKRILTGPDRPDAVFAHGDYRAKHTIDIAEEAGLRVPDDLAVMGYWNTPWAKMTRVPLTSVSIREGEIARIAVDRLVEAHRKGTCAPETIVVKPELVVRESCGAVGGDGIRAGEATGGIPSRGSVKRVSAGLYPEGAPNEQEIPPEGGTTSADEPCRVRS